MSGLICIALCMDWQLLNLRDDDSALIEIKTQLDAGEITEIEILPHGKVSRAVINFKVPPDGFLLRTEPDVDCVAVAQFTLTKNVLFPVR